MSNVNHGLVRRDFGVSSDGHHKEPVKSVRRKGFDQAPVAHSACGLHHVPDLWQARAMVSYADSRVDPRAETRLSLLGLRRQSD
jgi:hypothetical protein